MNGDMTEINIVFEKIQYPPATGIRQFYIEGYCNGVILIYQVKHISEMGRDNGLQTYIMRFFYHYFSKPNIIFNNQDHLVPGYQNVPVVAHFINDLIQCVQVL